MASEWAPGGGGRVVPRARQSFRRGGSLGWPPAPSMRHAPLTAALALAVLWACTPEEPLSAPDAGHDMTVVPADQGVLLDAPPAMTDAATVDAVKLDAMPVDALVLDALIADAAPPSEAEQVARRICDRGLECGRCAVCGRSRFLFAYDDCCDLLDYSLQECVGDFSTMLTDLADRCRRGVPGACDDQGTCLSWAASPQCEPASGRSAVIVPSECASQVFRPACECVDDGEDN